MSATEWGGLAFFALWVIVLTVRHRRHQRQKQAAQPLNFRLLNGEQEKDWRDAQYQPRDHRWRRQRKD